MNLLNPYLSVIGGIVMYDYGTYYLPVCVFREEYEKNKSSEFTVFIESLISLYGDIRETENGEWTLSVGNVTILLRKIKEGDWPRRVTTVVTIELVDCDIVAEQIRADDRLSENFIYIHNRIGQKFTYEGLLSDHKGILATILEAIFRGK